MFFLVRNAILAASVAVSFGGMVQAATVTNISGSTDVTFDTGLNTLSGTVSAVCDSPLGNGFRCSTGITGARSALINFNISRDQQVDSVILNLSNRSPNAPELFVYGVFDRSFTEYTRNTGNIGPVEILTRKISGAEGTTSGRIEVIYSVFSRISTSDFANFSLSVNVSEIAPVPLPASSILLLFGLGSLGVMRSRNKLPTKST